MGSFTFDSFSSAQGPVAGFCEHDSEPSFSTMRGILWLSERLLVP